MTSLRTAVAAGVALALAAPAATQPPPSARAGGTATRAVVAYSALEERLADRLSRADRRGLESLLADDFVFLTPAAEPLDRAAFLDAELARRASVQRLYALAVVERGELDLVSFLALLEHGSGSERRREAVFVVDAWRRVDQKLASRHLSLPQHPPPPPVKPTGRE